MFVILRKWQLTFFVLFWSSLKPAVFYWMIRRQFTFFATFGLHNNHQNSYFCSRIQITLIKNPEIRKCLHLAQKSLKIKNVFWYLILYLLKYICCCYFGHKLWSLVQTHHLSTTITGCPTHLRDGLYFNQHMCVSYVCRIQVDG